MKQRVPTEVLQKYYELWLSGATVARIMKKLNLSKIKFNKYTPDFLAYCRHQIKFDIRARMVEGNPPDLVELTPSREEEFLFHIGTGLTYPEAALLMDVPLITVTDYWFEDLSFKAKVDMAVKLINANVKKAFYRRVIGYEYDGGHITESEGTRTVIQGKGDDKTEVEVPFKNFTRVRKINVVEPDVAAGKFWLYNRMPNEYSIDGQRTNINNKGKILQWIEDQTNGLDDQDMENFDKEQEQYDEQYNK
ncbi:hypothetical protein KAR91_48840 [Candidatus Pacearchaeota archaeon]|nr:hypothetical protein [Candidatus Pacearchaeota archaeon]